MEKIVITEEQVKNILDNVLAEEMNRVSRQDFSRTQFKIEELQNSLNETLKEFRKLQDTMPTGLQTITKKRMMVISQYLIGAQGNIVTLKDGVRKYKRKIYSQQISQEKPISSALSA
jgi:hypothetical protein